MAELLRLDSARMCGNHTPGCVWSFFHVFDSYQQRDTKRLLSYRRMVDMQYSEGIDNQIESDEAAGGVGDEGRNAIVEQQRGCGMKTNSGKARILKFISKKLLRRQKHRGKMPHSSPEMIDITIHNSKSNFYVPQCDFGQMTSDSETSTTALSLDDTDSLPTSEHESSVTNGLHGSIHTKQGELGPSDTGNEISCMSHELDEVGNHLLDEHIILKEKLFEARDALLKQKDADPKGMSVEFLLQSKLFLDTLQLFNTNREALCSVCNGQISSFANQRQALGLYKSPSLSRSPFSDNNELPISSRKQIKDAFGAVTNIEVLPVSCDKRKQRESKTVLSRLRGLKQRIKGVLVENRKERHRISMDRILHKVPSGHKLVEDEDDNELHIKDGYLSEKHYRSGQKFKFNRMAPGESIGKTASINFRRSRSLAESLDTYSQLLNSISSNERKAAPERSNSDRDGGGFLQTKLPKTHGRMFSNPELLRSYSYSNDVQREMHLAMQSSMKKTSKPDGYNTLNSSLIMLPAVEEIACEQAGSFEPNIVLNGVKAIGLVKFLAPNAEIRQPGSITIVEEQSVWFSEQGSPVDGSPKIKPEKQSPISVLDVNIEEEPVSPLKLTAPAGSELQLLPHDDDLKEQDPITEPCNDSNEPTVAELPKPDFCKKLSTTVSDHANSLPAHVDEKEAAEFNYIKHMLSKSGYDALFSKTHDSSDGPEIAMRDMPCDEQLMHDLIHEVLLEMYEHSTAPGSWLPRFHSKTRPMPTGSYLLDEVWAEIRWHLHSSQGLGTTVDDVLTRNFAKDDGWMNLYRDAECYGLLLEQLIFDDLVDEIILDSDCL